MNIIVDFFQSISDDHLKECVAEIVESKTTSRLKDGGMTRKYADDLRNIIQHEVADHLGITSNNIIFDAAKRFSKQ